MKLENGRTWTYPPTSLDDPHPWLTGPSPTTEVTLTERKPSGCVRETTALLGVLGAGAGAVASYLALRPEHYDDGLEGLIFIFVPPLTALATGLGLGIGNGIGRAACSEDYEAVEIRGSGLPRFTPRVIPEPVSSGRAAEETR